MGGGDPLTSAVSMNEWGLMFVWARPLKRVLGCDVLWVSCVVFDCSRANVNINQLVKLSDHVSDVQYTDINIDRHN